MMMMTLIIISHRFTGEKKEYLNVGSYNYLGFAENTGPCAQQSIESIRKFGIASASPRTELGLSIT